MIDSFSLLPCHLQECLPWTRKLENIPASELINYRSHWNIETVMCTAKILCASIYYLSRSHLIVVFPSLGGGVLFFLSNHSQQLKLSFISNSGRFLPQKNYRKSFPHTNNKIRHPKSQARSSTSLLYPESIKANAVTIWSYLRSTIPSERELSSTIFWSYVER